MKKEFTAENVAFTLITIGSPYLLEGVGGGGCGGARRWEEGWEGEMRLECKMKSKIDR